MEITLPQLRVPVIVTKHQLASKTIPASASPSPSSFSSSSKTPQPIPLHQNIACANSLATSGTGSSSVHVLDATETDLPNGNNTILDVDSFESFPPGYRFCPLDEELVVHYLKNKVHSLPLPRNKIVELNLYSHNPEELAETYRQYGEKEWYFFTSRDKKYRNGSRPSRVAVGGYWKATGADKHVKHKGAVVGYRKALVFYTGTPSQSTKTDWIMHEYRVRDAPQRIRKNADDLTLDDFVLCRIYKKDGKSIRTPRTNEESAQLDDKDADLVIKYNDSPGYSNTLVDYEQPFQISVPAQQIPAPFSENPQFDNFQINSNYDDQQAMLAADSHGSYGAPYMTPMVETAVQLHPTEDIFTSKYLNENSCVFKSRTLLDERAFYSDDGNPSFPPQLSMVSLENIVSINHQNNPSSM